MPAPRKFALVRTHDQWLRASYENTALQGEVVQLKWLKETTQTDDKPDPFARPGAGLAFDSHCRLYHSVTEAGRIERLLWANHDPLQPGNTQAEPVDLIAAEHQQNLGDFASVHEPQQGGLKKPLGLAVDQDDRLFVAEAGTQTVLIYDLASRRLLSRLQFKSEPLDLVAAGRWVYVLLKSPKLVRIDARGNVQTMRWPEGILNPSRLAVVPDSGNLFILEDAGQATARIINHNQPSKIIPVEFATDIEFQTGDQLLAESCSGENHVLIVARRAGEDFLRFCIGEPEPAGLTPLKARDYDGLGIVRVPDGRIGFWTTRGFRYAVAASLRYEATGRVITFRLDSTDFHTTWGRLFIDACIPKGTRIEVRCITADEPPEGQDLPHHSPANTTADPPHADKSPPLPPQSLFDRAVAGQPQILHRRETGKELPWVRTHSGDAFETYEAPVIADSGRYLWVVLELTGNTRTTPRVKALRAEYPTHDYLKRLPKTFSREEPVAHFLQRYLAMFEGVLGALEGEADARAALLDPRSAPAEILPWLASFLGLVFDERMAQAPRPGGRTEDVRRQLIAEATWLFRFRGTIAGLRRFVEIYLGTETIILEKFRFRGLGGALLGDESLISNSVLGAGFRIGGAIGVDEIQSLNQPIEDAFATHAHRFSLVVPAVLTAEQRAVVQQILDLHRPSHTLVEICTVAAGMRVGRGLHVALTSIIGRSGGFDQLQLGGSTLGRGSILGKPAAGTIIGPSKLGEDSRPG
jgi:phage tail-like protein